MTRDCRCHRLFYPYFISSRSANSLKTKTTISPVRKNCELSPRWKLSKSNLATHQILSQSVSLRKRSLTYGSFDVELGDFDRVVEAFFDQTSNSIHNLDLDTNNTMLKRAPNKANAMRPQHHCFKRATSELNSSRVSSGSDEFPNAKTDSETSKDYYESAHNYFQEKENYDNFTIDRDFIATGKCETTLFERDTSPPTEPSDQKIEDYEPFIFNMSPFTSSQPCSAFSTTSIPDHRNSMDDFKNVEDQIDDPGDEEADEDERSISITSVLPIDIPQPQKSI